eukprot:TRINITY_DN190_c1_g3_i1.p1 TRINITY_DN190_c1_g3~~TRINITY_DN190_c1_g3_i1.p1  ORF type:complete len:110 (-),score=9.81 TRINITY_DN190_c1_g3_i1:271-600(-)
MQTGPNLLTNFKIKETNLAFMITTEERNASGNCPREEKKRKKTSTKRSQALQCTQNKIRSTYSCTVNKMCNIPYIFLTTEKQEQCHVNSLYLVRPISSALQVYTIAFFS